MSRLLAIAFYLGLGPVLRPFNLRRDDPFVQHHAAQAQVTFLVFLIGAFSGFLYWLLLTYVIRYQRGLYESIPCPERWSPPIRDTIPIAIGLLAWLVLWAVGLVLAGCGSMRDLPAIARLVRQPGMLRLARAANVLLLAGACLITSAAVYASSLTR